MARTNHFTDKQIINALMRSAGVQTVAAKRLQDELGRTCSRNYISTRLSRSASLRKQANEVLERNLDMAESSLLQAVKKGESWAVMFFLKTKGKQRGWSERVEVMGGMEHIHRRGPDIDPDRATAEELDEYIAARALGPA